MGGDGKMKVQIINGLQKFQWEDGYLSVFPNSEVVKIPSVGADVHLFMWCDISSWDFINKTSKQSKYIMFMRRYEFFTGLWMKVDWSKIDHLIFVNDFFANAVKNTLNSAMPKYSVIYNSVDTGKWTYKERTHGKKIAWVGFVNQKKNLPLAIQIMRELPDAYELHIAGGVQDNATMFYMKNISQILSIIYHGHISHERMDNWLEDKNYILNTAISEGCPNHVIEAMAKGIKPLVHNWPGSKEQFGDYVFDTVAEAKDAILKDEYISSEYLGTIHNKFGMNNYLKVKEIVEA